MPDPDEKDESFDATLARALGRSRESTGSGCPDASVIAAYREGRLRKAERASWEGHFAGCPRCQAQLAAPGRAGAPRRAAAPAPRPDERSAAPAAGAKWTRFAIPGGAAVVVIAIIVIVLALHHSAPTVTNAPAEVKTTPIAHASAAAQQVAAAKAPSAAAMAVAAKSKAAAVDAAHAQQLREEKAKAEAAAKATAETLAKAKAAEKAKQRTLAAAAAAARLARETPAPTPAAEAAAAQPKAGAQKLASAAPVKAAPNPMRLPPGNWVTIKSPDGQTQWKVGANGKIYHEGAPNQWASQFTGTRADLFAGSSPSPLVCWVLGSHGTILKTTDGGRHWIIAAAPASFAKLTWIAAMNGQFATVTLSDGHRYSTFDGGQSWRED